MSEDKKPDKYEVPSWDLIYNLCIEVADQVIRSGYNPEIIIAVSRGGWIPGRVLSDILGNHNLATIRVEYYHGIYSTRDKPEITQPLSVDVKGRRVLLVDDIADSGNSLRMVKEHLVKMGASEVRVCTLYQKPWSIIKPDFNVRNTDAWVCFPHERFETMEKLYARFMGEGMKETEIKKKLEKIGFKPDLVSKFISYRRSRRT
ncbi:MAG: phosphoribosyltransferase [Candidatus Hadarchaeales archaeon]